MSLSSPPESSLFTITPDLKAKYDAQFKIICPSGGLVSGDQAKGIMLKSGLPPAVLAHIWQLSDVDADGKMDINEFSIALHLIALKMKGVELPRTLPQSLKVLVEPPPAFAAFDNNTPTRPQSVISPTGSLTKMGSLSESVPTKPRPASVPAAASISSSAEWAIPQQSKLKYTQLFNTHDRSRTGFLTGVQARSILLETKLPQTTLAQVWNLSDIDADGRLTCEEFVLAMHLIEKAKKNEPLPTKLPPDFIPPSYRRTSVGGTLSHTSSIDESSEHSDLAKSSFEDKRRENFEKGQAELDRRRAALMEQQRREREERERKEREENARRERERLEAERRRQEEVERNQRRLLEQELEKEEQKRRAAEVKELARKEMERQRQRELEQARRAELLTQRGKLLEEVQKLKSRRKLVTIEHEKIDKQLVEKKETMTTVREKIVRVKQDIDAMKVKRDQINDKQAQIKAQMKNLTEKQLVVEQAKVQLAAQLKSLIANTSNGGNPDQQLTSFASILQAKQSAINQLRSQLERMQQELNSKQEDVANSRKEFMDLKRRFEEKKALAKTFNERIEAKKVEAENVRDGKQQASTEPGVVWGQEVPTNFEWPANKSAPGASNSTSTTTQTKFKYRCIFEFQARNPDELAIQPGDIVMVDTSACSEPDWLSGEVNGKVGWFPKDYVVLEEEDGGAVAKIEEGAIANSVTQVESVPTMAASDVKGAVRQGKALYDWSSTETGHISFVKGDMIRITDQHDSWCFGELCDTNGTVTASGWFPEGYVEVGSTNGTGEVPVSSGVLSSGGDDQQYYVSLFQFESIEPGDLGFEPNELIRVEKKDGDWWTGVIVDRTTNLEDPDRRGIFPSNFVTASSAPDVSGSTKNENATLATSSTPPLSTAVTTASESKAPHQLLDRKESESSESPKPTKKSKAKKLEIVTAIAAYTATGSEQLSLEVGQLIQVRKKMASGWWEGELQAKGKKKQVGWFPATYVKPLGGTASVGSTGSSARSTPEPSAKNASEEPEIERVTALYSFSAQREDEISFEVNDIIRVLSKSDPTWWRGHNTRTGAIGLFPSNHVQVTSGETTTEPAANYHQTEPTSQRPSPIHSSHSSGLDLGNNQLGSTLQRAPSEVLWQDYGEDDSFEDDSEGETDYAAYAATDTHRVHQQLAPSISGNQHEFDYSDSFESDDSDSVQSSSVSGSGRESQPYTVRISNMADLNGHKRSRVISKERHNLIYELVTTENDYINDLYFTIQHFVKPLRNSRLLSTTDMILIFGELDQIYNINFMFLEDLTQRFQESSDFRFCDRLLYHLQQMLPCYKKFCSNQVVASSKLQNKIENDPEFNEVLKKISIETKSHLPLSSFLLKPMQRITKYPLLIEKIYKCTPKDHQDYEDCGKALQLAKEFCSEINEACRKTENFNKLDWIQKNVVIPLKKCTQSIDFNSETQFLGPRTLLRVGILVKASSSKTLIAFLFNDLFMLTYPNKRHLRLQFSGNFFHNQKAMESTYTLYRKPLILDEFVIADLPEFEASLDPNMFRIFIKSEKNHITLRANSVNDCVQWLKEIDTAKRHYHEIQQKRNQHQRRVISPSRAPIGHFFLTIIEAVELYSKNYYINAYCKVAIGREWNQAYSVYESKVVRSEGRHGGDKKLHKSASLERGFGAHTIKGPFKAVWNCNAKLNLFSLEDNLYIRCYDHNPYAPHQCLGERTIPLRDMANKSKASHGPVTQDISLHIPHQQFSNLINQMSNTSILVKFDLILVSSN